MEDICYLDANTGFLYYRPTPGTIRMLEMSLDSKRWTNIADNDQYLLNCGIARAGLDGLNMRFLPRETFAFGGSDSTLGDKRCHVEPKPEHEPSWFGDTKIPWILHTAGMSTAFMEQFDHLLALQLTDLDANTGKCQRGRRGTEDDVMALLATSPPEASCTAQGATSALC